MSELKRLKTDERLLQEQLDKSSQKYTGLLQEYDQLKETSNSSEIQSLLTNAQKKVEDVKMSCEKVHSIKLQIMSEVNDVVVDNIFDGQRTNKLKLHMVLINCLVYFTTVASVSHN